MHPSFVNDIKVNSTGSVFGGRRRTGLAHLDYERAYRIDGSMLGGRRGTRLVNSDYGTVYRIK